MRSSSTRVSSSAPAGAGASPAARASPAVGGRAGRAGWAGATTRSTAAGSATAARPQRTTHKIWAIENGFLFPVLLSISGRTVPVTQSCRCSTPTPATRTGAPSPSIELRIHPVSPRWYSPASYATSRVGLAAGVETPCEAHLRISPHAGTTCKLPATGRVGSVVELWFYTPAVGGSIPSAPTLKTPDQRFWPGFSHPVLPWIVSSGADNRARVSISR